MSNRATTRGKQRICRNGACAATLGALVAVHLSGAAAASAASAAAHAAALPAHTATVATPAARTVTAAAPPRSLLHADVGGRAAAHAHHIVTAANTYTVTATGNADDNSTADGVCDDGTGHCTLRAAIEQANASAGSDEIDFAIGTGPQTIQVPGGTALPALTDTITIDGTSQPGYTAASGHPEITVDGLSQGPAYGVDGLDLNGSNDTVLGLDVIRFTATGIWVRGANAAIEGCYLGVDRTGVLRRGNSQYGVALNGVDGSLGETTAGARNVISANGMDGVSEGGAPTATGNVVAGSLIGLTADGTAAQGNAEGVVLSYGSTLGSPSEPTVVSGNINAGVRFFGVGVVQDVYVGTNPAGTAALGNTDGVVFDSDSAGSVVTGSLISGNQHSGVLAGSGATVTANYIGTDHSGTAAIGNAVGVSVQGTGFQTVVGGGPGAGNLVSGNGLGILDATSGDTVEGNLVGTDITASVAVPNAGGARMTGSGETVFTGNVVSGNTGDGIDLVGDSHHVDGNAIGTTPSGATLPNGGNGIAVAGDGYDFIGTTSGNTVADNAAAGIAVDGGQNTTIRSNNIHGNGGLGIDLGADGVTPNDVGDADTGANGLQNFPVITSAHMGFKSAVIKATLNSTPSSTYRLDVYDSPSCDSSGNGEGATWLGFATVKTDLNGDATISFTSSVVAPPGSVVTATSTDPDGSTSEFSSCRTVTGGTADLTVTMTGPTSVAIGAPATYTITVTNTGPQSALRTTLTDLLSVAGTLINVSSSQGSCTAPSAKQIKCSLGTLTHGSQATITAGYEFSHGGSVRNTAKATSTVYDPTLANDTVVVHTQVS